MYEIPRNSRNDKVLCWDGGGDGNDSDSCTVRAASLSDLHASAAKNNSPGPRNVAVCIMHVWDVRASTFPAGGNKIAGEHVTVRADIIGKHGELHASH